MLASRQRSKRRRDPDGRKEGGDARVSGSSISDEEDVDSTGVSSPHSPNYHLFAR